VVLLIGVAYMLYADRKIWAAVQLRRGPNVVGPWGTLQAFADLLKFVFKEPVIPSGANKGSCCIVVFRFRAASTYLLSGIIVVSNVRSLAILTSNKTDNKRKPCTSAVLRVDMNHHFHSKSHLFRSPSHVFVCNLKK
jgi:hypothetical protein